MFNLLLERHATKGPLAAPGGLDDLRRWARAGWAPIIVGILAVGFAMVSPHLALIPLLGSPIITGLVSRKPRALPVN